MSEELLKSIYKIYPLYQELFDKQLEFVLSPSNYIAAICSRRAGKTTVCAIRAFQELMMKPNSLGLYLALTDDNVERIFMPTVRPLLAKYKITANVTKDEVAFSNGSRLILAGANHINRIETFRGFKLVFCIIDEAASFTEHILQYLVDEIISPALIDNQGQLILIGTPANHCSGMFYNVTATTKEESWVVKRWTGFDNPHITVNYDKAAKEFLKRKKVDETNPKYRREYLGEWCTDEDALMIRPFTIGLPSEQYNTEDWRSVVGVDFGFNDETAISVIGWRRNNPTAYVLETVGLQYANVSTIGNMLKGIKEKYKPIKVVGDPAGSSKIIMAEFSDKYKVFIESAQKTNKAHYIEIFNDALVNDNLILVPSKTETLQKEMKKVVWNEDRTRELEGMKCDHLDATLYAYREAMAYIEKIPVKITKTEHMIEQEMLQSQIDYDIKRLEDKNDDFFTDISNILD